MSKKTRSIDKKGFSNKFFEELDKEHDNAKEFAKRQNELKEKINNLNFTLKISDSIDSAIHSNSKDMNTITLVTGSLYLIGEVLNSN